MEKLPFVSVVVPTLNSPERTSTCIEALLAQTYPKNQYEVIIIDNGSSDHTPNIIQEYPVIFLKEGGIRSPYAARNRGIIHGRGEIIAMTDVNCTPVSTWLEEGVKSMKMAGADLVGGKVTFTFSPKRTSAECYDSVSNVKMKSSIDKRGVAKGGNLFVHRRVFKSLGLFPEHMRSGGDIWWTGRATKAGFKLIYSPKANAYYPARTLLPLLKKSYRVGKGQMALWLEQAPPLLSIIINMVRGLRPPRYSFINHIIQERGTKDMLSRLPAIWGVSWMCSIASNMGRISYVLWRMF
jgi:glycosyltransferase involved in cell wall biosynthesis